MTDEQKEVEPALTVDEWSGECVPVLGTTSPKLGYFVRVERPGTESLNAESGQLEFVVAGPTRFVLDSENLHKLAALALYGQPFGFTHDDVSILWGAIDSLRQAPARVTGDFLDALDRLATRIESLLPPREPSTEKKKDG